VEDIVVVDRKEEEAVDTARLQQEYLQRSKNTSVEAFHFCKRKSRTACCLVRTPHQRNQSRWVYIER